MKDAKRLDYEVFEDNAGGITLCVIENDVAIWAGYGYEERGNAIAEDIQALKQGINPVEDGWESPCDDPQGLREELQGWVDAHNGGAWLVADSDGVYRDAMGVSGTSVFAGTED